ncbi:MAG: oligopeptide transporter, OPT family [Gammaproteobacteria bacterium]|nr:oligopeptide transporter, OPT family [Gammaproteobacteria bacterium]
MVEEKKFIPFVSSETNMAEFTVRAIVIGLVLAVILGAANAYLGLKAGMTIAATYPAAVIGMALLKLMKGSILEENITRTIGSIGESIAAGAIFTIPAFFISGVWEKFDTIGNYLVATAIMFCGGLLGIMFVVLLRRVLVNDAELPFPESVAASEIHKAGRAGGTGAKFLFGAMGFGGLVQALGQFNFFASSWQKFITFSYTVIGLRTAGNATTEGGMLLSSPGVSPAFLGVGYIIGPKLASLNFSGGMLAWGVFVPIILYFIGPELLAQWQAAHVGQVPTDETWINMSMMVWKLIVRPMAIGGMLVGAAFTLFKMRKSLISGVARSVTDLKKSVAEEGQVVDRTDHDLNIKWVLLGICFAGVMTFFIYNHFTHNVFAALVATVVMIVAGFFFAAVSGYLCGIIGSSNNPVSGLTLSTLVVAALLMVALGMTGKEGVAAVLGVAAVVCVSSAVAGEMLQDLKVGRILGGTPWRMQFGDVLGVAVAAAVMFIPLVILNQGDINAGKMALHPYDGGFGSVKLSAPQASLMALLSQGIIGGHMAWPLIVIGMLMGVGFILMQVRSPMLVSIGMYLSLDTTFAIFIGGMIKGILEMVAKKKQLNEAQRSRVDNVGTLIAAGLIAGEALAGLIFAALAFFEVHLFSIFDNPSFAISLVVFVVLAVVLIKIPLKNAGSPDQPAPPHVVI